MNCDNNLFTFEITSKNLGICEPSNTYFWIAVISVFIIQIGRHYLWTQSGKNHRELMSLSIEKRNKRCDLFGCLELIQFGKSAAYAISIIILVSGNGWVIISHILGDFVGSWLAFHVVEKDKKHLIHNIIDKYNNIKHSKQAEDIKIVNDLKIMFQDLASSPELKSSSESKSNIIPGVVLFSKSTSMRF
jgi:hypothetical protein